MITDPVPVKFTKEIIRPLCERSRALKAEIDSATNDWYGGTNALFPNDATVIDEARNDGVPALTGADINSVMNGLIAASAALNPQVIAKPCVQPLHVAVG